MTSPKRAEPAKEHARNLGCIAYDLDGECREREASECRAAAAEIERLAALERPWLPIASAPRDGTRVELWCERTEDIETQTVARFPAYGQYEVVEGDGIWLCNRGYPLCPTHYRPEPAGPESKPDQETKGER